MATPKSTKSITPLFKDVTVELTDYDTQETVTQTIRVTRIKFGNHIEFLARVGAVINNSKLAFNTELTSAIDLVELAQYGGQDLIKAVALAIDRDVEFMNSLSIESGYELVSAVIEINADYLTKKVVPSIVELIKQVKSAMPAKA